MNPRTTAAAFLLGLGLLLFLPASATGQISDAVNVAVSPASNAVVLGEAFEVRIDVTNDRRDPTPPLVVHIDITDPRSEHSVDPEDWTATLTRDLGVVDAGQTRSLTWELQPISPGAYSIYAVALSSGVDNTAISNVASVEVADQRSLNPGGVLPVAIAVPAVTGGLLVVQTRRRRRGLHRKSRAS